MFFQYQRVSDALWKLVRPVRHINHTPARVCGHRVDRRKDAVAIRGVESLARRIEDDERRVFYQRAREKHEPLLPFRNIFEQSLGPLAQTELLEPRARDLFLMR